MVAVGEHSLGAESVQIFSWNKADVAIGTDAHKSGGFDLAVGGFDNASTAKSVWESFFDGEFHVIIIA